MPDTDQKVLAWLLSGIHILSDQADRGLCALGLTHKHSGPIRGVWLAQPEVVRLHLYLFE